MKGWTVLVQIGWCGFGVNGGLLPELRLGVIRLACCRGWIFDAFDRYRRALIAAGRGFVA